MRWCGEFVDSRGVIEEEKERKIAECGNGL